MARFRKSVADVLSSQRWGMEIIDMLINIRCKRKSKENKMSRDVLYHYYPYDVFKKIVESRKIRFSEPLRLNDPDGITYLWKTFFENKIVPTEYVYDFFSTPSIDCVLKNELYFVFCLTELDDSAYMWKHYGDNGKGVCIGFSVSDLESWKSDVHVCRLEKKYVRMDDFGRILGPEAVTYKNAPNEMIEYFRGNISAVEKAPFVKDGSFSHEQEYRMVICVEPRWMVCPSVANACLVPDCRLQGSVVQSEGCRGIIRTDCGKTAYLGRLDHDPSSDLSASSGTLDQKDDDLEDYFPVMDVAFDLNMIRSVRLGPRCPVEKNELKILLNKNGYVLCDTNILYSGEITREQIEGE